MRTTLIAFVRRIALGAGILVAASTIATRAMAQELRDAYHTAPGTPSHRTSTTGGNSST